MLERLDSVATVNEAILELDAYEAAGSSRMSDSTFSAISGVTSTP